MKNQEKISKTISMGFSDITRHEPYDSIYPKKGGGGGDKEKYPAGSLYYPATDDEPAVITTKTLEGRTPTMVCIVPDGVLGENAVFAHISNNGSGMYFPYSTSNERPFVLARLNTTATNITSNNSVIFDEDNVPILPPYVSLQENRLIVQPTTPGLEYEIMNVHRSGQDQEDTGYYGGFIQVNGEYSEKAKDYQRVYSDLTVLQKEDNLFTITHEDEYNKSKFGDSDVLVQYGNEFKGRTYNYLNSTTYTWNNGPISYTNEYATALELAAALKFQNKWSKYIDPEHNKFGIGNIMSNYEYADEMAERDIARVFPWFVNLDNGYVGVGVNYAFSPLYVSRIDKNENIVEPIVFEQKFAAKTIRPALCDLYEGFDITFNKQWGESLLLNEINDNIIGVEFILEDNVDPASLKVSMYDNDKQKVYSEQITSTHMTYMYKDMYDAGEISTEHPMRVTLQKRTEGAGTVRVKKIYALFDNDQRAEMYPTQFNNTYVKIIWKTEGGDDKLRLIEKYFPDANFRAALAEILGINEGDEITNEMQSINSLDVSGRHIADLTGIEYFFYLDTLYCDHNDLTSLNLSEMSSIQYLHCHQNQFSQLYITGPVSSTYEASIRTEHDTWYEYQYEGVLTVDKTVQVIIAQ